ncbi:dihydrolipoyl dehydrogenase [Natrononativus amylolyticus]|uniref:dihydrolipoyl dehydrogenase n=1 Tax=Natrononativus amylolyticus TaxID=2963434 RepID=UPI0020CF8D65|nr:dihydrolipoyl dehydrogenase [Natrononativus amylolyticus]
MTDFDIIVLGGGSGSQVATAAAEEGLEAVVVEPGPLGGACVTRGCVPSKALIHRADVLEEIRGAERFGIDAAVRGIDYAAITDAIHDTVYEKADAQAESLEENEHVTLYRGAGRFLDDETVLVEREDDEDVEIRGKTIVVAVGSRPVEPPIDGLEAVDYYTSDDVLYLDDPPESLLVVGGGYIGAEMGYFFDAVGTAVTMVGRSDRLLPREDEAASEAVTDALAERFDVHAGHEVTAVSERDGGIAAVVESDDETIELTADALLLATGRRPNTDTLDLENAGIDTDDGGAVDVDEFCKTSADGVWALGDVIGAQPYKHAADYEARCVTVNVLEDTQQAVDYDAVPHAVFTRPRVASVGRTEEELAEEGLEYEAATVSYDAAPLGLLLESDGFVKVLAEPDGGEILGCHVVGPEAPTLIQEVVVAMERAGGRVDDVVAAVHVHPALSEVILAAFDELSTRPYSTAPDWRDVGE